MLFELLVCCCCAACAAIIIACTNRPIDWKHFDALCAKSFSNTSRTNIDRIRAEFSSKHKRRSHDSFTTKEYKSVRRRRSLPSLLLLLSSSRKVVRLSFTYDVEITFGETSSEFSSKEKSVVFSVALFLSLSHKRWRRLTRRRTKKRERERGFYRERSYISASLVFLQKRLFLPRGVVYWCVRFVSRGGCAQRMLERGEEDSFPLHKGRRRGCDFWSHSSSEQQF